MKTSGLAVLLAFGLLASCGVDRAPADPATFGSYLQPSSKYVRDRLPVEKPSTAPISQLVLSVPTFEGSGSGGKSSEDGIAWVLFGDGAQCPVIAKRTTPAGQTPVRLKLIQGASPPQDPETAFSYELEKIPGGWKILSTHKGKADDLLKWPME